MAFSPQQWLCVVLHWNWIPSGCNWNLISRIPFISEIQDQTGCLLKCVILIPPKVNAHSICIIFAQILIRKVIKNDGTENPYDLIRIEIVLLKNTYERTYWIIYLLNPKMSNYIHTWYMQWVPWTICKFLEQPSLNSENTCQSVQMAELFTLYETYST